MGTIKMRQLTVGLSTVKKTDIANRDEDGIITVTQLTVG